MSRPVRIHIPQATYLVQIRAREEVSLFHGDEDRELFFQSLGDAALPAGVTVYAFALLEKSALLFLRAGRLPLSRFVHRTQAGFFNRLRAAKGQSESLIRDRHRAILVEEGDLFLPVVRRVHISPIIGEHWSNESEARKWGEVSSNRWTSFPIYTGTAPVPEWFAQDEVLEKCKRLMPDHPTDGFYRYIIEGVKQDGGGDLLDRVVAMSLLGSEGFVDRYYERAKGRRRSLETPRDENVVDSSMLHFLRILTVAAEYFGTSTQELRKARSRHPGRKFVVELALRHAVDEGGVKKLGERLGVSGSALAHLRRAFRVDLKNDPDVKALLATLEKKVFES
ncbi:MAG: hypothetical protein V2A56_00310 [bacterium]